MVGVIFFSLFLIVGEVLVGEQDYFVDLVWMMVVCWGCFYVCCVDCCSSGGVGFEVLVGWICVLVLDFCCWCDGFCYFGVLGCWVMWCELGGVVVFCCCGFGMVVDDLVFG